MSVLSGRRPAAVARVSGRSVEYLAKSGEPLWRIEVVGERGFRLHCSNPGCSPVFSLSPAASPPTIWASETKATRRRGSDNRKLPAIHNEYRLPMLVHFPDYGILSVQSGSEVVCSESWIPDEKTQGLNLGHANIYHHTTLVPYHHGEMLLQFRALDGKMLDLDFRVEDEMFPQADGRDFSGPRWAGLRRCWMNAFTIDRKSLTMGDNILLGGIAHLAIHFKSEMSLHTPSFAILARRRGGIKAVKGRAGWIGCGSIHDYLRRALDMSLGSAMNDKGEINWTYQDRAKRNVENKSRFMDCTASNLIAFANYCRATGDVKFLQKHLRGVAKASGYLLSSDRDGDGLIEMPFHGNRFEEERTRNWWDNFAFGWKDAYMNLLSFKALRRILPLLEEGMDADIARMVRLFIDRFPEAFRRTFHNPDTGCYAGWVSRDGRMHDYLFTFIGAMAVNEGVVCAKDGRKVMRLFLRKMSELGYDGKYGVPGNLVPVAKEDTISWDAMGRWGVYENGGLCGMTAGHFIEALYRCGMRDEADEILFKMLDTFENQPTHSGVFPGYCKSVDWRTKEGLPCGYNYLADNYYFLIAAMAR